MIPQPELMPDEAMQALATSAPIHTWRYRHGEWQVADDTVAGEVPVALVYNGISHAVMLATPCDLEDFALGFSLSEGLIRRKSELRDIEIVRHDLGIELHLEIAPQAFQGFKISRRQLAGLTGCGLCGQESLAQAIHPIPTVTHTLRINPQAIEAAIDILPHLQTLHQITGGVHAAAWANSEGQIMLVREDVGRHNALDKLLGAMFKRDIAPQQGFLLLTSRASHELVYKAAFAGIELIAAVSAPTSLALKHAQQAGLTLIGWVRKNGFTVYEGLERLHRL